ncbi:hypothetical protein SELMODRAFT_421853 [Selaginella moellendorffii]|uniref:UDP-glycosyltransferases domain-containing protein n=1 Tax=Selaginella moellendorffii TaxID=88036 RepID=D8SGK1_SELML|nr:hypothetical protein SELMODRAFT_421853 [Selaginella moellendorffii]
MADASLARVSCMLTDVVITSLQDVARQFGICKVTLSTFSASWLSIQNGHLVLKENGLLPLKGTSRIIDFVPGLPPIAGRDFTLQIQEVHPLDPDFSTCSTSLLETIQCSFQSVHCSHHLHSTARLEWTKSSRGGRDNEELQKLFEDPSYDKCKFVSWAPQLKVLKHPSVGAFLTHCGWNSLLETIVAGVSVLGWPFLDEQPLNCVLAVEHWKICYCLPRSLDATIVEKAGKNIMGEAGQMWINNVAKPSLRKMQYPMEMNEMKAAEKSAHKDKE